MTLFWIIVAVLVVGVVALLLVPIFRAGSPQPRYATVIATGALLPALVIGLYFYQGQWRAPETPPQSVASVESAIVQLAERLEREGGNSEEWFMLGRSYMVVGNYVNAVGAFGRARQLGPQNDPVLSVEYAEALVLADRNNLLGQAGQLFEEVLAAQPLNPKALWYGAAAAFERGERDLAVSRWQELLAQNPPAELVGVLEQQIRAAGGTPATVADAPAPAPEPGTLRVMVSAPPELLNGISAQTPLFVLARGSQGGPPLAVRRLRVGDLPAEITLSERDSMVEGLNIVTMPVAQVVARIAVSGTAEAKPGDLFAEVDMNTVSDSGAIRLSIDQRVE